MLEIDIAHGIIFQKLSLKNETRKDNTISQKKIYLLQHLGSDLGYEFYFHWSIHGPYSHQLSEYMDENYDRLINDNYDVYKLQETTKNNINRVNKLTEYKRDELDEASWFILLSIIVYIYTNKQSWHVNDINDITETLMRYQHNFNKVQINYAFNILLKEDFITK